MIKNILKRMVENGNVGYNNEENRDRWLEKTLGTIPPHSKILDAGAGQLRYKKYCTHLEYTSQDFAQYDSSGDNKGLQTGKWDNSKLDIVSDIISIPVKDNSFDAIMCIEVLEHIPDPSIAIKELSRILKPKGTLLITAPFCSLTHFAPYHFSTGFSRYFYETILDKHGLKIVNITPNGNYYEYIAQETRRLPDIISRYSGSKMNIFENIFTKLFLRLLNKYNRKDSGSSELLCFGYFVVAQKK